MSFFNNICATTACALLGGQAFALTLPNGQQVQQLTGDALWGCQVFLCLANPDGPKAVGECVPPIDRLIRECIKPKPKHRKPFPKCAAAGAGNDFRMVNNPWDPCEAKGMTEARRGWIAEGKLKPGQTASSQSYGSRYWRRRYSDAERNKYDLSQGEQNNTNGEQYVCVSESCSDGDCTCNSYEWVLSSRGTKACVKGNPVGTYTYYVGRDSEGDPIYRTVTVYEEVYWQKAQSWTAFDVRVNGRLWHRAHINW